MPAPIHPAALPADELLEDVTERRGRRSGPGGQHRNKVETAVMLEHAPSGIRAEASERRSQQRNREMAVFRLRVKLAVQLRRGWEVEQGPGPLWTSRLRAGRIAVNPAHEDFPALLAEALDAVEHFEFDVKTAAEALGCSTSQLIKLLKLERIAWENVNAQRQERGLRVLR